MFFMGLEVETYEETDDGPELMEVITDNPDGLTIQESLAKYIINPGGGHPVIDNPKYSTGPEFQPEDIENAEQNEPYLVEDQWQLFFYTNEEQTKLESLSEDLGNYVSEMEDQFVTRSEEHTGWVTYVEKIENMVHT